MSISVWDTYVKREDGKIMHFDILVPSKIKEKQIIINYGEQYLKSKPFKCKQLTANECSLCHMEHASIEMIGLIKKNGYAIIEMESCI